MNLAAIQAEVYRRLKYQPSPSPDVVTRIAAEINEAQQELTDDPRLQSLLRGETSLTTVASQAEYGLPPHIGRITTIRDTSNRWPLRQESLWWYRTAVPDQTVQTGTPSRYILLGPKPVVRQPVSTGVWADSSSASDTSGPSVSVEAVRSGGYLHQPDPTALTGVTRVQIGSQTDYVELTDFYLDQACVGDVTLYDAAAAGNVLGFIPAGQTRSTSNWIAFAVTPSDALTYQIDYERIVTDLVNPTDEPYWLPTAFHRLLAIGARRKEYEYRDDERLESAVSEWNAGLNKLVAYVNNPPGAILIPGGASHGRSDLGSWYPSSTIWD